MATNIEKIIWLRSRPKAVESIGRQKNWLRPLLVKSPHPDIVVYPSPSTCETSKDCPTCAQCVGHFYPLGSKDPELHDLVAQGQDMWIYAKAVTEEDARQITSRYVSAICEDLKFLRSTLVTHGDLILAKWTKISVDDRRRLLCQVRPDINKDAFLLAKFMRESRDWVSIRKHAQNLVLQYINLDTLGGDSSALLKLLHVRTAFEPQAWTILDKRQVHRCRCYGLIDQIFNEGSVSILPSDPDLAEEDQWGQFYPKFDTRRAHRLEELGFPVAEKVLETQTVLYSFLRKMVTELVKLQPISGNARWLAESGSSFVDEETGEVKAEMGQVFFTPPQRFDLGKIVRIAQARLESAKYELKRLQTEPRHVQQLVEKMETREYYNVLRTNDKWGMMAEELWRPYTESWRGWEVVRVRAEQLQDVLEHYERLGRKMEAGPLPEPVNAAFGYFGYSLEAVGRQIFVEKLGALLPKVKRFEKHYEHNRLAKPQLILGEAIDKDTFFGALVNLQCHGNTSGAGWEIEYAIKCFNDLDDSGEADLALVQTLSDIGDFYVAWTVFSRAWPACDALQKEKDYARAAKLLQSQGFGHDEVRHLEEIYAMKEEEDADCLAGANISKLPLAFRRQMGHALKTLCTENAFPSSETRDMDWLTKASASRKALHNFWAQVKLHRGSVIYSCNDDVSHERIREIPELELFDLGSSKAYLQELEDEAEEIRRKFSAKPTPPSPTSPAKRKASELRGGFEHGEEPRQTRSSKRRKRASDNGDETTIPAELPGPTTEFLEMLRAIPDENRPSPPPSPTTPIAPKGTIQLKKRDLDVFAHLWRKQSGQGDSGIIRWKRFELAMKAAGCQVYSGDGSAYNFTYQDHTVQIHQVHGKNKAIPQQWLDTWGKRIRDHFGWGWEMFKERGRG